MAPARETQLIELALRNNPRFEESESQGEPRYFFLVNSPLLKANPTEALIPVYWGPEPRPDIIRKEIFRCSVFGKVIKKGNLPSLMQEVRRALGEASSGASLPSYMLSGGPGDLLPVYSSGGRLGTSVGSTPIQAANIVEVWRRVAEHLSNSGKLQDPGALRILTVGHDLNVFPQAALLLHPPALRLPVLQETAGGEFVYTFFDRQRLAEGRSSVGALENLLGLWHRVAQVLLQTGKARDAAELRITQLRASIWDAQKALAPASSRLTYSPTNAGPRPAKISLAVFQREGNFLAGLPAGEDERTVFISSDLRDLAERVGKELVRQEQLEASEQLAVESLKKGR